MTDEWVDGGFAIMDKNQIKLKLMGEKDRTITEKCNNPDHYWCYTDGAGPTEKLELAGYGAVMFNASEVESENIITIAKPVLHGDADGKKMGASKSTNNEAEMCGIIEAMMIARENLKKGQSLTIVTDSAISMRRLLEKRKRKQMKTMSGTLITNAKIELALLRKKLEWGSVHIRKVRAHNKDKWNHVADRLAAQGRDEQVGMEKILEFVKTAMNLQPPTGVT